MSETAPKHPARLHLFWALPIPVVFSSVLLISALWDFCGISGCTGGGFGISRDIDGTIGNLLPIPFLIGLPIFLVPWSPNRWVRAVVALVIGVAFAGLGFGLLMSMAS
ncbi:MULTISPECIES: hypothetical protein [Cryobacterium]|uniref:Uncharacterized protein n=1 Tax=Cryobacterium breve TaxID=1259258 RepID=A0ABY2J165_9MICO|nr:MULTISPECIES: hypothetical protein [Cryobacterium]TFC96750.1 hypothetical protein E3T20_01745 [Cryobacterium sp. TmT3-12]TFC97453.1 hypothetical protein E3O65_11755 [Cryobacterium breve]